MKLLSWWRARSLQEKLMLLSAALLLAAILTRWSFISRVAGDSFRRRFIPEAVQCDTLDCRTESRTVAD